MPRDYIARNRAFWDADSDAYQGVHGDDLATRPLAWGAWRRPEDELRILGDVAARDMLELGCGAAQWTAALHGLGANCTGIDLSARQLRHARAHCVATKASVALALASAEALPFRSSTFDVVFSDHGAISFCDPERVLPEVGRVLRPGGLLAFCTTHPLVYLTWNNRQERQTRKLHMHYDRLGQIDFGEGTVDWVLPPGTWVRLLRGHGFEVEDLVELSPLVGATTTYDDYVPHEWAEHWPAEQIWRARRR
jgi:SAM-dependent methyltransferase